MTEPVVRIRDLQKRFGSKRVLNGADLELHAGSVVGLLGRNGAGKTTLIQCLLGLRRADAGTLRVFGEDSWNLSGDAKGRIGYVPQEAHPYPWMRVGEVLDYLGAFYPRWDHLLVQDLTRRWGLGLDQKVSELSGGERQKVALIASLGHGPELLILDEPAAALDPAARRAFLELILDVVRDGERTVLFSTHILSDLERVADRVAILREGLVVYSGELDTLKEGVKRLRIVAPRPLPRDLGIEGILQASIRDREAVVSVLDGSPARVREIARRLEAEVQVQDLNLEDIFLEMAHG
jgi:ABC-2 type transport system ATP-binding protein